MKSPNASSASEYENTQFGEEFGWVSISSTGVWTGGRIASLRFGTGNGSTLLGGVGEHFLGGSMQCFFE